jgi:hypothetical protein
VRLEKAFEMIQRAYRLKATPTIKPKNQPYRDQAFDERRSKALLAAIEIAEEAASGAHDETYRAVMNRFREVEQRLRR